MDSGFGTVRAWLGFYLHCLWTVHLVLSEPGQSLVRVLLTLSVDSGFGSV